MHCHIGFAPDALEYASLLAAQGVTCFSNTVTPQEYQRIAPLFAAQTKNAFQEQYNNDTNCTKRNKTTNATPLRTDTEMTPAPTNHVANSTTPTIICGVGLHPWWVEDCENQLSLCEELLRTTHFVGEVGLDAAPRHASSLPQQQRVFTRIATCCAHHGNKLLSIHSVRSATQVLDILEGAGTLNSCAAIFHWFSGNQQELTRLLKLGCYVSVNPHMAQSKKGRAYIKQTPAKQLLLETDLPEEANASSPQVSTEATVREHVHTLKDALQAIYDARGIGEDPEAQRNLLNCINTTSASLLRT